MQLDSDTFVDCGESVFFSRAFWQQRYMFTCRKQNKTKQIKIKVLERKKERQKERNITTTITTTKKDKRNTHAKPNQTETKHVEVCMFYCITCPWFRTCLILLYGFAPQNTATTKNLRMIFGVLRPEPMI